MELLEGIDIYEFKPLAKSRIETFERVNVICGKNSSGKSSLLRAIESSFTNSGVLLLKRFKDQLTFEQLRKYFTVELYDRYGTGDIQYEIQLPREKEPATLSKSQLNSFLSVANSVFESKANHFWNKHDFYSAAREYVMKTKMFELDDYEYDGIPSNHETSWEKEFAFFIKMIFKHEKDISLIPAKRNFKTEIAISEFAELTDDDLLKYLFASKGMLKQSARFKNYQKLSEAFAALSGGVQFDVVITKEQIVLCFLNHTDTWVRASNSGLGLSDLLYMLTWVICKDHDIYLIEEPENHLHPELQRKLLHYLKYETTKQFFIATHSNVFLDTSYVDKIYHTAFEEQINIKDATSKALILQDLGYTSVDNLSADLLLLVEGKTDAPIFEEFLTKYNNLWNQYNIKVLPLGGITNMPHVDLSVIVSNYNQVIGVVDGDMNRDSVKARNRFKANCQANGIKCYTLQGYGIENYISLSAFQTKYSTLTSGGTPITLQTPIKIQIPCHDKNDNRDLANLMTLTEIENTGDLYALLQEINEICKTLPAKI